MVKKNYLIFFYIWNHLIVRKQLIDIKLNYWYLMEILEAI